MKLNLDFNNPRMASALYAVAQHGASVQKKTMADEARMRKAVNATVDAFWKRAPLSERRAFLARLAAFATERNVPRLEQFAESLTEAEATPVPQVAPAEAKPATGADKKRVT